MVDGRRTTSPFVSVLRWIALAYFAGVVMLAGFVYAIYYYVNLRPPTIGKSYMSPDGKYRLEVGYREFINHNYKNFLLFREGTGPSRIIAEYADEMVYMKWSPDSSRAAWGEGGSFPVNKMIDPNLSDGCTITVFDVRTKKMARKRCEVRLRAPRDCIGLELGWKWLDSESIEIRARYRRPGGLKAPASVAVYRVESDGSSLRLEATNQKGNKHPDHNG